MAACLALCIKDRASRGGGLEQIVDAGGLVHIQEPAFDQVAAEGIHAGGQRFHEATILELRSVSGGVQHYS